MDSLTKFTLFIACLILASCSPKYYVPNTQNVPLISSKGDFSGGVAGNGSQFELQASYGIADHIGLMADVSLFKQKDDENGSGGSGKYFEGGLGYFSRLGAASPWIFETYGLFGIGNMENHFPSTVNKYPNTTGKIEANVARFALQPAIGYKHKYFEIAASPKFSYINYSDIKGSLIFDDQDQIKYLIDNKSSLLFEPALTLRFGLKQFKLQLQLSKSLNLSNEDFKQDKSFITVGCGYQFTRD